jgi:aspartyl-tRNA(Asn)/glutamyl-tRNA(Gln) amidotransferase subunit A
VDEMTDLWKLDGAALAAALAAGDVSAVEVTESALSRLAEVEPRLNAFCHVDADGARQAALASDARRRAGASRGPLDGVPFSVKDNLFVAGLPASWGSRLWHGFVPDRDDLSVERLKAAGAVNLGKTTTPEFASIGSTFSDLTGVTRSPFGQSLSPGGSSGGATASVAAGVTPYALGTDAGGSIRMPGSITGLYGLRASTGAVARAFGFPPLAFDFQAIGLLTRTLADLRTLFAATSGPDHRDPASLLVPASHGRTSGLKVGWFGAIEGAPVDPEVTERLQQAAVVLDKAGHRVEETAAPYTMEVFEPIWPALSPIGATLAAAAAPSPGETPSSYVAANLERARGITAADYGRAMNQVLEARRQVSRAWGDTDVYLLPCTPTAAWPAESTGPAEVDGRPAVGDPVSAFNSWVNVIGYPGLSVPVTPYPDGRPIGVQLVARPGQEESLFALAETLLDLYPAGSVPVLDV